MGKTINNFFVNKLVIFFVTAFIYQIACGQVKYEKYTDEIHGFSIEYLSDWKIIKSKYKDGGTHFVDASNDPPLVAVNVNKVKTDQSLEAVAKAAKKYVSEQQGVREVNILSENAITASQMKGIENIMTYNINGNEMFIKSAHLVNGGYIFSISMAGTAKTIEEMQIPFKHMIEHIEIL